MNNHGKPRPGEEAPDFSATDLDGVNFSLKHYRGYSAVTLVFLRHAGCPLCKSYMVKLAAKADDFRSAGSELIVFIQSSAENIRKFAPIKSFPFRVVPDPDCAIYELYGVKRAAPLSMLAPSVLLESVKATAGGFMHGLIVGDELRAPGAFIIDKSGILRMAHIGSNVADIPPAETLLKSVVK